MKRRFFSGQKNLLLITAFLAAGFISSCKKADKKSAGQNQNETENNSEELYDFYSPAEDDASWVEALLVHLEEERIAEQLSQMEDELSDYEFKDVPVTTEENPVLQTEEKAIPEEKNPVEKFFEEAGEGRVISGKNNELRFYEFQNEILSPQYTEEGLVIIHSSNQNVSRFFYNEKYQLVKKEEWIIKSSSDSKKDKTELYEYSEENGKIAKKEIQTNGVVETILYNPSALPLSSKKYAQKDNKNYIIKERFWNYDEDNRVLKDEQKEYTYKNSDYKNKPELFSRCYEYKYNDFALNQSENQNGEESENETSIPPDFRYYENNILKMQNRYSSVKGNYYSWIYFDDSLSVKTYYEDDVRVMDEYYNNGSLFRTKVYEKAETVKKGEEK